MAANPSPPAKIQDSVLGSQGTVGVGSPTSSNSAVVVIHSVPLPSQVHGGVSEPHGKEVPVAVEVSTISQPQPLPILKGAWEKPLISNPSLHQSVANTEDIAFVSQWPALNPGKLNRHQMKKDPIVDSSVSEAELEAIKEHSKDYSWAAKMNPALRNLHRVTIPEYMEDGTPKGIRWIASGKGEPMLTEKP